LYRYIYLNKLASGASEASGPRALLAGLPVGRLPVGRHSSWQAFQLAGLPVGRPSSWQAYCSWQAPVGKPTAGYAAVAMPTAGFPAAGRPAVGRPTVVGRPHLAGLL